MNKLTQRLIGVALCATLVLPAASLQAFADSTASDASDITVGEDVVQNAETEYDNDEAPNETYTTNVYLTRDNGDIRVSVPKAVIVSGTPDTNDAQGRLYKGAYRISVEGDFSGIQQLTVAPKTATVALTQPGMSDITATIDQPKTVFSADEALAVTTADGLVYAETLSAGSWHGLFSIDITLGEVPPTITEWDVSEAQDESVIASYNDRTRTVTISGDGAIGAFTPFIYLVGGDSVDDVQDDQFLDAHTDPVTGKPMFDYPVEHVVIEDGITSIGAYAFAYSGVTSIAIPDSVTSIGDGAFVNCNELGVVEIPSSVVSIGEDAFDMDSEVDDSDRVYYCETQAVADLVEASFLDSVEGTITVDPSRF